MIISDYDMLNQPDNKMKSYQISTTPQGSHKNIESGIVMSAKVIANNILTPRNQTRHSGTRNALREDSLSSVGLSSIKENTSDSKFNQNDHHMHSLQNQLSKTSKYYQSKS